MILLLSVKALSLIVNSGDFICATGFSAVILFCEQPKLTIAIDIVKSKFILGDETDELGFGFNTRTIIFNFTDLDNPFLSFEYTGSTPAIDHNGYVNGNLFYMANYSAGMKVFDITNIADGGINEASVPPAATTPAASFLS